MLGARLFDAGTDCGEEGAKIGEKLHTEIIPVSERSRYRKGLGLGIDGTLNGEIT